MAVEASPFGVNTYSYMYAMSAGDCVRHLMQEGYRRFELMMFPGHIWPSELTGAGRKALRRLCEEEEITITALNQPNMDLNLAGATPEMRAYTMALMRGGLELAADLGAPALVIGPGKPNGLLPLPRETTLGWFHDGLSTLSARGRELGVDILVENMPMSILPRAADLMTALAEHGDDEIGIAYDVANAAFLQEDLAESLALLKPRLKAVHLSDTRADVPEHRSFDTPQGVVPIETLAQSIRDLELEPTLVFEIISGNPDADLKRSAAALERRL
ncbi:MAG: sugar phosphate isomerase/epimerase family protein [Pseudomonadota bacterium]